MTNSARCSTNTQLTGADMSQYDDLLEKTVNSITQTYKKRAFDNLTSGRGGALPLVTDQVSGATDFELVTWLVIENPEIDQDSAP